MNAMQKTFAAFSLAVCTATAIAAATGDGTKESLEDRIKPVGDVCMAGDPCAAAVVVASAEPRSGEVVYSTKCFTCHATGAAGAPKLGDAADWSARLAERGEEALYTNAWAGYKAMPAKGLCMDCSEDEIKAAVDHILVNSK